MTQNFAISPRILVLAIALLLSLGATALSQEITGSLVGTVTDAAGAAVSTRFRSNHAGAIARALPSRAAESPLIASAGR